MNPIFKSRGLALLALALLLISAAPAMADQARGNIALIDPDNHTFTMVDENNNVLQMRFLVGGQVLLNDQEATIWDLLPGDQVTVTFDQTDGQRCVTAMECRRIE